MWDEVPNENGHGRVGFCANYSIATEFRRMIWSPHWVVADSIADCLLFNTNFVNAFFHNKWIVNGSFMWIWMTAQHVHAKKCIHLWRYTDLPTLHHLIGAADTFPSKNLTIFGMIVEIIIASKWFVPPKTRFHSFSLVLQYLTVHRNAVTTTAHVARLTLFSKSLHIDIFSARIHC